MRHNLLRPTLLVLAWGTFSSISALAATSVPLTVTEGGASLQGTMFLPEHATGSVPLVLVVPEWWGKNDYSDARARQVADQLGAAAISVDVYGGGFVAKTPDEAKAHAGAFYKDPQSGVRRLNAFLAAAPAAAQAAQVTIDPSKTLAIGYCFGGTQVLNLARANQMPAGGKLLGVASFHGGLSSSLHATPPITAKILVLQGGADSMTLPEVAPFKKEMKDDHADLRFIEYPGATHAFTSPAATELGKKFKMPIAYNESADKKSWAEFKTFYQKLTSK